MADVDLTSLLQATVSPDDRVRVPALEQMMALESQHWAEFLNRLVREVGTAENPDASRMLAALQIKRVLTGQDGASTQQKTDLWNQLDPAMQTQAKECLLHVLGNSPKAVAAQAAQAIEAIARLELPQNKWAELPDKLAAVFVHVHARDPSQINAPLAALGYFAAVAAKVGLDVSEAQVNQLLSNISAGMKADMTGEVQAAATDALADTLEFARHNMEKPAEREQIMKLVLEMTRSKHVDARESAFRALGTVLDLYYQYLPSHMEAIWQCTTHAIRNDEEPVAKLALNFWSDMCLEESERNELLAEKPALPEEERSREYVKQVRQNLCTLVLDFCLLQQPEEPDDDDSTDDTLYGTAENCFVNLVYCQGGDVVTYALEFSKRNLVEQDWRRRQAALFALGAVLREAPSETVKDAMNAVFIPLLRRMLRAPLAAEDPDPKPEPVASVRETAAWAVSLVCSSHFHALNGQYWEHLVKALLEALKDVPRVAHMAAAAMHAFAGCFQDKADDDSNPLSNAIMQLLAGALWTAAVRPDAGKWQLMEDAYEALIRIVEVSAKDKRDVVKTLLGTSLRRLAEIGTKTVHDETGYQEVELCGVVSTCVIKLDAMLLGQGEQRLTVADKVVETMILILRRNGSSAHADALGCLGEVTRVIDADFERYMVHVQPLVERNLAQTDNAEVCVAAVRLCADICTAMGTKMAPKVGQLTQLIYANLSSNVMQMDAKPPHLTILGDIATAVGPLAFKPYFGAAMGSALMAANLVVDISEPELADYVNVLREAALESMEMMVIDAGAADVAPYLQQIGQLALRVSMEVRDPRLFFHNMDPALVPQYVRDAQAGDIPYQVSPAVLKGILGLLGDLAGKAPPEFRKSISAPEFAPLFNAGATSQDTDVSEIAKYALKQMANP